MRIVIPKYYSRTEQRIKGGEINFEVTSLAIIKGGIARQLHCLYCGELLPFQYVGEIIKILPGETPTEIPFIVKCPRRDCRHTYLVEKILTRD